MLLPDLSGLSLTCRPCGVKPFVADVGGPLSRPAKQAIGNMDCEICQQALNEPPLEYGGITVGPRPVPWAIACTNQHFFHRVCLARHCERQMRTARASAERELDPQPQYAYAASCPLCRATVGFELLVDLGLRDVAVPPAPPPPPTVAADPAADPAGMMQPLPTDPATPGSAADVTIRTAVLDMVAAANDAERNAIIARLAGNQGPFANRAEAEAAYAAWVMAEAVRMITLGRAGEADPNPMRTAARVVPPFLRNIMLQIVQDYQYYYDQFEERRSLPFPAIVPAPRQPPDPAEFNRRLERRGRENRARREAQRLWATIPSRPVSFSTFIIMFTRTYIFESHVYRLAMEDAIEMTSRIDPLSGRLAYAVRNVMVGLLANLEGVMGQVDGLLVLDSIFAFDVWARDTSNRFFLADLDVQTALFDAVNLCYDFVRTLFLDDEIRRFVWQPMTLEQRQALEQAGPPPLPPEEEAGPSTANTTPPARRPPGAPPDVGGDRLRARLRSLRLAMRDSSSEESDTDRHAGGTWVPMRGWKVYAV